MVTVSCLGQSHCEAREVRPPQQPRRGRPERHRPAVHQDPRGPRHQLWRVRYSRLPSLSRHQDKEVRNCFPVVPSRVGTKIPDQVPPMIFSTSASKKDVWCKWVLKYHCWFFASPIGTNVFLVIIIFCYQEWFLCLDTENHCRNFEF